MMAHSSPSGPPNAVPGSPDGTISGMSVDTFVPPGTQVLAESLRPVTTLMHVQQTYYDACGPAYQQLESTHQENLACLRAVYRAEARGLQDHLMTEAHAALRYQQRVMASNAEVAIRSLESTNRTTL